MKLRSGIGIVAAVSVVVMFIFSCKDPNDNPKGVQSSSDRSLQTIEDSVSYILGMGLSQQYSFFNEDDYRPEMVQKAMNDFLSGEEFKINDAEKKEVLTGYFRWARAMKDDSLLNQSERWLKENAEKEGVVVTNRGLQYKIIKQGSETGVMPDGNDIVQIKYTQGNPQEGILWDQSMATNKRDTIEMALNRELTGFSEMCQLMREGDVVEAWLPPRIGSAEGLDPAGIAVKNQVIFIELEILKVKERRLEEIDPGELKRFPGFFIDESRRSY